MDPAKKKKAIIGSLVLSAAALGVYYWWSNQSASGAIGPKGGTLPSGAKVAPVSGAASGAPAAGGVGTTFPSGGPTPGTTLIIGLGADGCPVMQTLTGITADGRPVYGPQWQADICVKGDVSKMTIQQKAAAAGF